MQVKILWADDEIELLKPHILFLEAKGYTVDAVNNGSEAVEKSESNTYDIILMDLSMPVMDGYEATVIIRGMNTLIPIIALTASSSYSYLEKALQIGVTDYIIKPFNPKELNMKMRRYYK